MSSFRSRFIDWIEARGVKARRHGAQHRHEALIGQGLLLIIEHDPLSPDTSARAWIRLAPLPYEAAQRKIALNKMLSFNHKIVGKEPFGLTLSDEGEFISLACRARAVDISKIEFQNIIGRFFGWAERAHQQFVQTPATASLPDNLNIRYL